jgi:hypothetical protein
MALRIDEPSDLDIVNYARWLIRASNDQVLLLRSLAEFYVPCGDAVDAAAGENGVL